MTPPAAARFAARPVATLLAELADALHWPRSRPARLLAGDRAARAARFVICLDEAALAALDAPHDVAVLLATPPTSGDGRLGRRIYDPFAGAADDVTSWRRTERVVLDASLLLAGGRGGIDERIATHIGLTAPVGLVAMPPARPITRDVHKLVGYVPADALEAVRDAVFAVGAGTIGGYDRCSWSVTGTGTFRGGDDSNPTIGTRGEFERVAEERFEVVVASHLVDRACRAFVVAHPYEEPAFDVVPLAIPAPVGFGRIGLLGEGGGEAAWTALGTLDGDLVAYGGIDKVAAGTSCIVHAGPLRDVLDAALAEPELGLVIASDPSDAELELLDELDIALLAIDRARAVDAFAIELAGQLTRALTLPVTSVGTLQFPAGAGSSTASSPAASDAAAAVFGESPSGRTNDYATGTWRLHFDGGSRGNPGPAAYGWVLYDPDGEERESDGVKIGTATNNVAEWTGLLRGLEHARGRGIRTLSIRGDSELVVKQVTGVYKVKNETLKPLAEQVKSLMRGFARVDVKHVYRADNARADAVANEAMDGLR